MGLAHVLCYKCVLYLKSIEDFENLYLKYFIYKYTSQSSVTFKITEVGSTGNRGLELVFLSWLNLVIYVNEMFKVKNLIPPLTSMGDVLSCKQHKTF